MAPIQDQDLQFSSWVQTKQDGASREMLQEGGEIRLLQHSCKQTNKTQPLMNQTLSANVDEVSGHRDPCGCLFHYHVKLIIMFTAHYPLPNLRPNTLIHVLHDRSVIRG